MDALAVWTGVVGAAVGGSIALVGTLIQAKTTRGEGKADRRHGIVLAHQNFLIQRRAEAYVELLEHINLVAVGMHSQMRQLNLEPPQPGVPPSEIPPEKWSKLVALVRGFASEPLRESFMVLHNTQVNFARIVETQLVKEGAPRPVPLTNEQVAELQRLVGFVEMLAPAMNRIIAGELQELDWDIQSYVASLPGYSAAVEAASVVEAENEP